MSAAFAPIPVFLVAAQGTETGFLLQSLSTDGGVAIATLVADAARGERSVSFLANSVQDARFVFLAADPGEPDPVDLVELAAERWRRVECGSLLAEPRAELERLCAFVGIDYDQALLGPVEDARRASLAGSPGESRSPFTSASTATFAQALAQIGSSLLISTYQTGRLVCARLRDDGVNTHFREYDKPMGIAVAPGRIVLGTRTEVWDLRDMPEAAAKLEPPGSHDACYLPRNRHVTGDIAVHDIAFAGGELWLVATAFSCLATLDANHSFVPRWAPPFITELAPEDRCHLNGLAVVEDRIQYVTALGTSDEAGGWRAEKAGGGVVIDVASSEVVIGGLSMPHSPRWHQGRLWLLESGTGSLCVADLDAGSVQTVAELPGFTRGLAFAGEIAFVGLSQIRESSTFGELPLTRRLKERQCGVWMVNTRSGSVVGFLRFEDLVQEIFDVAVLAGTRFPEIAEASDSTTARSYALP
jgi:uncharacterized protein (TIGR03032 family)